MSRAPECDEGPPRRFRALLERFLPDGAAGGSVLADLDEEFLEQSAARGLGGARRWYRSEALKLAWHFAWRRWAESTRGRGIGMNTTRHNVVVALRQFRRAPVFMITAIATIALGIGATVATFSLVDAVLLDPLPYEAPDELVAIWEWNLARDERHNVANPGNFVAWRDGAESFAAMTAISLLQPVTVESEGRPDEAMAQYTSPDFFSVLGLRASLGRAFSGQSGEVEGTETVLSDRYWRERFGADPGVIGRSITLNGSTSSVIVGVLPPDYVVFGEGADMWVSVRLDRGDQTNTGRWLMVLGRLRPDATLAVAGQELKAISASLEERFPEFDGGWSVNAVPLEDEIVGDVRGTLWMLFGAVGLLLLIACGNVANLFMVRATARRTEMAVRTSLGASGGTLAGQLLTEGLVVALSGALLGVGAAHFATRWMATRMPEAFGLPRVGGAGVDGGVLLFAALVSLATVLLFGALPAIEAARTRPGGMLLAEGRGASGRTRAARDLLVIVEMGLSVVLLTGAALFVRSFVALASVDDGIEAEHVLVGRVNLSTDAYRGDVAKVAFFDELIDRLEANPNVAAVGGITFLPMDGMGAGTSYWVTDRPVPEPEDRRAADIRNVEGDYFDAMGIELLQGRLFDERDGPDAPQTVVVNRRLAEQYWPGESAVGKQVVVNWLDDTPWEIVGVVEDVRHAGPAVEPRETIYIHYAKATFFPFLQLAVRGRGQPEALAAIVRTELAGLDASLPLGQVRMMNEVVSRAVARPRMTTSLMLMFAALATVLAAVGLYGVLAYTVSKRVQEIGIRVALGAEPGAVVRLVAAQGTRLALIGLCGGLLAASLGAHYVSTLLYGIQPSDPISYALAGGILAAVSVVACTVPAWRATRVAPAEALRPD